MKKFFTSVFFILISCFVFAEQYQITNVEYNISSNNSFLGKTQPYALEKEVPVNKNEVFNSQYELNQYINDLSQKIKNTRAFDSVEVLPSFGEAELNNITPVTLTINVLDSLHLFMIPGPKYDSNSGLSLKLKIKDSNFLGSLNNMNSDLFFLIPTAESDNKDSTIGINFDFDYPFKLYKYDSVWVNDLGLSYTFGSSSPEWNYKTGFKLSIPFNRVAFVFELYQKFVNDFSYSDFNDNLYFDEEARLSLPLTIADLNYFGKVLYTPYASTNYSWDFDGISEMNSSLSSPVSTIGHKLSFGRTDWNGNLRTGLNTTVDMYLSYNFQRQKLTPIISLTADAFKDFDLFDFPIGNKIGLCTNLFAFSYLNNSAKNIYIENDGIRIGGKLRGIRDEQTYKGTDILALNPTCAIVMNFDLPYHLFTTNLPISFLNFDLQMSPFIDAALTYNKITKKYFDPKDGFYSAGLELIVNPVKWSGITIRASVGIDAGRTFFSKYLNTDWRSNTSKKEFSLGFGLHY